MSERTAAEPAIRDDGEGQERSWWYVLPTTGHRAHPPEARTRMQQDNREHTAAGVYERCPEQVSEEWRNESD